jgi:deazaflavin-dependent oxidoreductase (nitroreductase family)
VKPPDLIAMRKQMDVARDQAVRKAEGLMLHIHREIYVRSEGRFGKTLLRVPSLLLTVKGRRSGTPQTVALVYATDGADYVVVASNGGQDRNPDWFENLRQTPSAEIQIGRAREQVVADVVDQNDRRYAQLWRLVNANNHGRYYRYQHTTSRPIPIVILRPS